MSSISDQGLKAVPINSTSTNTDKSGGAAQGFGGRHRLLYTLFVIAIVTLGIWFFWDFISALLSIGKHSHSHSHHGHGDWNNAPSVPTDSDDDDDGTCSQRPTVANPYKNKTFRDSRFADPYTARM